MTIEYGSPLSRAVKRMQAALFHPVDAGKWLTIGFAAFLSSLLDGPGHTGSYSRNVRDADLQEALRFPGEAWQWLQAHSVWLILAGLGLIVFILILLVLSWLSARGKFIFIANVAGGTAEIVGPWHEYRREGNSYFLWRLAYGLISLVLLVPLLVIPAVMVIQSGGIHSFQTLNILTMMTLISGFILAAAVLAYIDCFLDSFIVPIMYSRRVRAAEAWRIFFKPLFAHPGHFFLYGIFRLLLNIAVLIMVITFGLFTCCLGFVLLIIPYIGTVVLLPVSYTLRGFSLEYLEQFGPEYRVFSYALFADHAGR